MLLGSKCPSCFFFEGVSYLNYLRTITMLYFFRKKKRGWSAIPGDAAIDRNMCKRIKFPLRFFTFGKLVSYLMEKS